MFDNTNTTNEETHSRLIAVFARPMVAAVFTMLLAVLPHAGAQMGPVEYGVDRPGKDFDSFPSDSWQQCSASCATNNKCSAYTYVKPQGQAKRGTCWVKGGVAKARKDNCCVSGIKVMGPYEPGVDRPGRDLRAGYPTKTASSCRRDCQRNSECWAWTFVKPGIQGSQAMCWLKSSSPEARASSCCMSGIRLAPTPSQGPIRTGGGPKRTGPKRAAGEPTRTTPPKRAGSRPTRASPRPSRSAGQPTRTTSPSRAHSRVTRASLRLPPASRDTTRTNPPRGSFRHHPPRNTVNFTVVEHGPPMTMSVHQIVNQCRSDEVFVRKDDCGGRSLAHVAASSTGAISLQFHADPGQQVVLCCDSERVASHVAR